MNEKKVVVLRQNEEIDDPLAEIGTERSG